MTRVDVGFTSEKLVVGNKVKNNAWVVKMDGCETLVSYGKNTVHKAGGKVYLDQRFWDMSVTTAAHREAFLGNPEPFFDMVPGCIINDNATRRKVEEGEYIMADLNVDAGFTSEKLIGNKVKNNAWVVKMDGCETLVSYGKNTVHKAGGKVYLDQRFWKVSFTTAAHREAFLGNPEPFFNRAAGCIINDNATRRKVEKGEYIMADLNGV